MDKRHAEIMATNILLEQGYLVSDIGSALKQAEQEKSIRAYGRVPVNFEGMCACTGSCKEVIDSCIVARKNEKGEVVFGTSSVHPLDIEKAAPKKVTGMVASAKAILAPNSTIPMKFEEILSQEGAFVNRCFDYFRVDKIKIRIASKKKSTSGKFAFVAKNKIMKKIKNLV